MAKDKKKTELEEEVWNAISAFEQILEAMPNDRESLMALAHAYQQIGDLSRARDYTIRLGNVMLDNGDISSALNLVEESKDLFDGDPKGKEFLARLEGVSAGGTSSSDKASVQPKTDTVPVNSNVRMSFNMADELSCAWNLMEGKEISEEEYSSIVQDLTDMSASSEAEATISVLHVLEARGSKNLEKVISFVSRQCGTPFVGLSGFDVQVDTVSILPWEFVVRRGAFLFDLFGGEGLVVVMNPYDKQLRKDVESLAGRRCHFYTCLPSEFDTAISKAKEIIEANKAEQQ